MARQERPRRTNAVGDDPAELLVLLIEDNRIVRDGLTLLLTAQDGLRVVAADVRGVARLVARLRPRVVLLDVGLRSGDSLRIARQVRIDWPAARVILMDLLPAAEELDAYVDAGVTGFTMKDATVEELVATIRRVAAGELVRPPVPARSVLDEIARVTASRGPTAARNAVRMTPRERQVIDLIAEGHGNREIGERLHIATHTVKSHVRNVMEKLALHTRLQIAAYAYRGASRRH